MRIALITLAVAALAFIGSIIWIFAQKNGIDLTPAPSTSSSIKIPNDTVAIEILRSQWKTEDRIKELETKIDAMSGKNPIIPNTTTPENTNTSNSGNTSASTGATIIPISAKFLTKVISKMNLTLTPNNGIYGLYLFDTSTIYSTYTDAKSGIIIIATRTPYTAWLANW